MLFRSTIPNGVYPKVLSGGYALGEDTTPWKSIVDERNGSGMYTTVKRDFDASVAPQNYWGYKPPM